MHIGIFAERFVGRYGADRVLVIIAEQLRQQGHQVTLVGVRFSRAVVERFSQQTFRVPDFSHRDPETRTLQWFQDVQYFLRRKLPPFDLCIIGSYPFISAIPYLRTLAREVIFIDFGVVPTQGYPAPIAGLVEMVRANRRAHLRHASCIVPISSFIAESQSRPECEDKVPIVPILLGADHLTLRLGYTEDVTPPLTKTRVPPEKNWTRIVLDRVRDLGRKLVLVLGRWEPGCYKNSQAAFQVLRSLCELDPDVGFLITADPHHFRPEPGLEGQCFCIGLPSDAEMNEVTGLIDAGISVSLWEGFNLPVAELQHQEKEVFAFNLAAHPEVVVAPEQLCADTEEMTMKLYHALREGGRPAWVRSGAVQTWREKFSWQRFQNEFAQVVERAA
jgi:glycosyltransferase involved in cell wall biosynthesis